MTESSSIFFAADTGWIVFGGLIALVAFLAVVLGINFFSVWIRALFSGARVEFT